MEAIVPVVSTQEQWQGMAESVDDVHFLIDKKFEQLEEGRKEAVERAQDEYFKALYPCCRYNNIICYLDNQVDLGEHTFIDATQYGSMVITSAPKQDHIPVYFQMLWKVASRGLLSILRLTKLFESNKSKADEYLSYRCADFTAEVVGGRRYSREVSAWVDLGKQDIEELNMGQGPKSFFEQENKAAKLFVELTKENEKIVITSREFYAWPDHGVPHEADLDLLIELVAETFSEKAPVVVHCSAGVGRTGTVLTAIEGAKAALGGVKRVNLSSKIEELRSDVRSGLVQTEQQYHFIPQLTVELFKKLSKTALRSSL